MAFSARMIVAAGALLGTCACEPSGTTEDESRGNASTNTAESKQTSDPIQSAMSAAPEAVSRNAAIVMAKPDGTMQTLRQGNNGFTCMPDNPVTPGPDPMCMDQNAMQWAMAWIGKTTPPADTVGIMYMLAGGTDASNTDPYAQRPTEGNQWIETGPHLMVVGSQEVLKGYPSGGKPDTKSPYVMWSGTPYAHLMIPTQ